jgi:hypothetical protein
LLCWQAFRIKRNWCRSFQPEALGHHRPRIRGQGADGDASSTGATGGKLGIQRQDPHIFGQLAEALKGVKGTQAVAKQRTGGIVQRGDARLSNSPYSSLFIGAERLCWRLSGNSHLAFPNT